MNGGDKERYPLIQEAKVIHTTNDAALQRPPHRSKHGLFLRALWIHVWVLLSWTVTNRHVMKSVGAVATATAEPTTTNALPEDGIRWSTTSESAVELERYRDQQWNQGEADDVIVIATVDGTLAGLSRTTGKTLWKKQRGGERASNDNANDAIPGKEDQMRPQYAKQRQESDKGLDGSRLLDPLVSTTTTTKSSSSGQEWRTAAVPSLDGRVYLTVGREANGASTSTTEMTATTTVRDLVSRAPFVDGRGRFYVGSRHATAAALDRDTGEILRVVSGDNGEFVQDPSLEGRNVVWLGRVDYSVSLYDARTGVTDVQFSASEVISVNDMLEASDSHGTMWDVDKETQQHAPRLMLPNHDGSTDPFALSTRPSLLVATPNGNVALRNPETGQIQWVAHETFDTPVAFALDSSSGMSLGVDILPDAPVPSTSVEYLSREMERQMEVLRNKSGHDDEQTIVGALPSGQLFAMPLGQRRSPTSKTPLPLGLSQPHSVASSSSVVLSSKHLSKLSQITGRHTSQQIPDLSTHPHGNPEYRRHSSPLTKKVCNPVSPGFPGCLVGTVHKGDHLDWNGGSSLVDHQHNPSEGNSAVTAKEAGAVTIHYIPQLGYMAQEDQMQDLRNRKSSRAFLRIMASWLPPTMALIFVLSFELGRRQRLRREDKANEEDSSGTIVEDATEKMISRDESGVVVRNIGVIQVTEEVLGYGGHGTVVYKGMLDGRKVAVKRMLKAYHASADREISLLIESDGHPNVVRYFLKEVRGDFVYLALELCDMSMHDLIGTLSSHRGQLEKSDSPQRNCITSSIKLTLLQIASGVRHLHSLRIVHRDLKPANILLAQNGRSDSKSRNRIFDSSTFEDSSVVASFERGEYVAKISDMGLGKQLTGQSSFGVSTMGNASILRQVNAPSEGSTLVGAGPGSVGWQAPEVMALRWSPESASIRSDASSHGGQDSFAEASPLDLTITARTSRSVDIFSLGCIFYCTLVPGSHPFGEWYEREANIMRNKPSTQALANISADAYDLVTSMIDRDPKARPTAKQVCCHPFFWSAQYRLAFLCDVSDRLESESMQTMLQNGKHAPALTYNSLAIERNASQVVGIAWDKELDHDLVSNVSRFRTYDPSSVRDCLRLIRNKHHHYDELPANVKERVGPNPEGLIEYFEMRFPRLLLHCYTVCRELMTADDPLAVKYSIISSVRISPKVEESKASSLDVDSRHHMDDVPSGNSASLPNEENTNTYTPMGNPDIDDNSLIEECSAASVLDHHGKRDTECLLEDKHDQMPVGIVASQESLELPTDDIIIWEGSNAAKKYNCRGWMRSDDEWVRRTDASLRKRDSNIARCADDAKFRTRLCNHWDVSRGTFCPMRRRNKCVFAHGPVELRVKEGKRHRWGKLVDKNGNNANPYHSGGEDTYGAARSIESVRKVEGKWNTEKSNGKQKGKLQIVSKA